MLREELARVSTALGIEPQCDVLTWEGMGRVIEAMEARRFRLLLQRRDGRVWRACFRPCRTDRFAETLPAAVALAAASALVEVDRASA